MNSRQSVSERHIRHVWKLLSDNPHMTRQELADAIQPRWGQATSKSSVSYAINELTRRGILSRDPRRARSIVIKEPFSWFDAS